jgi:glutaminyl-tRNA synthetase
VVVTRFPPEPNGYLHIGHAKSICLNFGLAQEYGGTCNLRFDDTNPDQGDVEYVESIQADVRWLGFDWGDALLTPRTTSSSCTATPSSSSGPARPTSMHLTPRRSAPPRHVTEPGTPSPYRDRSVAENLDLFRGCAPASSPTARTCCAPRSTWRRPT